MVKRIAKHVSALRSERGQALAEYALIVALVTLVCFGALELLGQNLGAKYQWIVDQFPG